VNGCTGGAEEFEVTIDDCTGIDEGLILTGITVYPNPVEHSLNITCNLPHKLSADVLIYNFMGQVVHKEVIAGTGMPQTQQLDVSHLPGGMYIIHLQASQGQLWKGRFEKNR
jgi:hypothetical protein